MLRELQILIADQAFETRFQPIVDPRLRRPFAWEAFTRAARFAVLAAPEDLFAAARRFDLTRPLDQACVELAVRRFQEAAFTGRLMLNLCPATLLMWNGFGVWLEDVLKGWGLDTGRVIVSLTGQLVASDVTLLRESTSRLKERGYGVAIDSLGSASSGLMSWAELRPDYLKIDRYFLTGIEHSPVQAECVRSAVDAARALGSRVIAEGIETAQQCERVVELGADYVQGNFIASPGARPGLEPAGQAWLENRGPARAAGLVESLLVEIAPVTPDAPVMEAVKRFFADAQVGALPVVVGSTPVGMVWRDELFTQVVASARESARKPNSVRDVMDTEPPVLDIAMRITQAARVLSEGGPRRRAEFLVVDADGYRGVGRLLPLLHAVVEQQQDAASLENPLTQLPGNRRVREQLERLRSTRGSGVLCHLDIDHFRGYNEVYGQQRGDQVLVSLSESLSQHVDPDVDFVGHVGSDDFVLVLRSRDWRERLNRVLQDFTALSASFYEQPDREAGTIRVKERTGSFRRVPLMSLSVAALDPVGYEYDLSSPQAVALMRKVEALAKGKPGNAFFLAFGGHIFDLSEEFDGRDEAAAAYAAG